MKNPNKSPILDLDNNPAGLVGGYGGERSPLQPPLKESTYYETGELESERIATSDGKCIDKIYYKNGQLKFKRVDNPDGSWSKQAYTEDGQPVPKST